MGTPKNFFKKFKFVIDIDGVARLAFKTCSELRVTAETVKHREGGRLNPHKAPGLIEFPPITLTRGATIDFDLYNWFKDTFDSGAGTGLTTPNLFRQFDIIQQDRQGEEVERHTVFDAFVSEYSSGDWDNDANEVRNIEVVIEADRWEPVPAKT